MELRSLTGPFFIPLMVHEWVWSRGGLKLKENRRTWRRTCHRATVFTANSTWSALGANVASMVRRQRLTAWATALSCLPYTGFILDCMLYTCTEHTGGVLFHRCTMLYGISESQLGLCSSARRHFSTRFANGVVGVRHANRTLGIEFEHSKR
jgi:hypothetical protein